MPIEISKTIPADIIILYVSFISKEEITAHDITIFTIKSVN